MPYIPPAWWGSWTITTKDEGATLSSTVTTLDFVGAWVSASGSWATTTVTIPWWWGKTFSTTATAGWTTTLTSSSNDIQEFTWTSNQIVQLPVTSTLSLWKTYSIFNNSTWIITIKSSGSNDVTALNSWTNCDVTCILTSGTTPASWEVNLDEPILTKTTSSFNNSPLFTTINKFDVLETNFYWTGTVALDTTTQAEGTGCMKLTLATGGATWPRIALPKAQNFYKTWFSIKVKASAWANVASAEILCATEAWFSNYFVIRFKWTNGKLVTPPDGEWIERTFNPWDFPNGDKVGTPNWWAITHFIIRWQASSWTPDLFFDDFKFFSSTQKPFICCTYDDGLLTQYTNGKAKLDQYDMKWTFYTIWNEVGGANNMTLEQLETLSLQGHDIAWHWWTNLTTLTQAQRIVDLKMSKAWNKKFRWNEHYALPNGAYTNAVITDVIKYYSTIANIDWLSNSKEYTPNYILNRFSPDSGTSTATIQAWIDQAIANSNMVIIAWHWIVASGATGAQVNQSTYDTIMDYIGTKKNWGFVDTGTISDYYASPLNSLKKELRVMPWYLSSEGKVLALQEAIFDSEVAIWQPPWNATTVPWVFGMPALTAVGTATARNYATTRFFTRMKKLWYVSAATAGSLCWPRLNTATIAVANGSWLWWFFNVIRFWCSDAATVSGARQFVWITSTTTALTNVEPSTLTNCVWVWHWTADTNLKLYYGWSAAQTPIDLWANFPANTLSVDMYDLRLWSPSNSTNSEIYWEVERLNTWDIISGVLNWTIGTTRPATTTLLTPINTYRTNNATALAVWLDIALVYTQTNQF